MKKISILVLFILMNCPMLFALNRAFVSPSRGNDANACTIAAPCRQFTKALSVVSAGGEIVVLDSGGFSPFTVDKAVLIDSPVYASIIATSGDGITINTSTSDVVVLRGLTVNGMGTGINGIRSLVAGIVHIENCSVLGFNSGVGITVQGNLFVKDTLVKNSGVGIDIAGSGRIAVIDNARFEQNSSTGIASRNSAIVTVRNCVASGNSRGLEADNSAQLNIENCLVANNLSSGVESSLAAIVRLSNSVVTNNATGLSQMDTAELLTRANNTVEGNTTDTQGTIGKYNPQ